MRVGGPRSMTVARPRVGPPVLGRAALPGGEPPHILAFAPGAGRAMGMAAGPGRTQPNASKPPSASQAEPAPGRTILEGYWCVLGPQSTGEPWTTAGRSRPTTLGATAGRSTSSSLTSGGGDRRGGVRVSPPSCREPSGRLPARRWVTEDGPHPPDELGAVAATCERSSFSPACHPRATSSGHERYPAVSHGHSETAVVLDAGH